MTAAPSNDDNEVFNTPHLPERYQQTIRAKKQRRLRKQLLIVGVVILVIILAFFVVNWAAAGLFSGLPSLPSGGGLAISTTVTPDTLVNDTPSFTQGPGLTSSLPPGVLPLNTAVAALGSDYPASVFTIRSANLTSYNGRFLYEFHIQPDSDSSSAIVVYIDARSGKAYSPGEETTTISRDVAQQRALAAFPSLHPERSTLTLTGNSDVGVTWEFDLYRDTLKVATGIIDAESGDLTAWAKIIQPEGRPAVPSVDAARARSIADRYIIEHNGGQLPLNMSEYRYEPVSTPSGMVAGQHVFSFDRTFQDYPTDIDGFTVIVDAVTGEVIGYTKQWTTPEHAFFAVTEPDIIKREATFAVMQKAKEEYPNAVGGLRIISAEIRWKNAVPYGTISRPGTIPLGWKVVFDDDIIRANASAKPAVAWVDIQSGDFIEFDYRH
jgi:hypothetical protein